MLKLFKRLFKRANEGTRGEIANTYNMTVEHFRGGKRLMKQEIHNIVTSAGKARDAGLFNGVFTTPFTWLAIGLGTAAAATGDTALGSEVTTSGGARATATCTTATTTVAGDTAQLVKQWDFTGTFAVTESGIFDASTAGNLAARQVFSAVNVVSGDSLQITWKMQKS